MMKRHSFSWLSVVTILCVLLHCSSFNVLVASAEPQVEAEEEPEEEQRSGTIIGIDLGTTYSCVGVFQPGLNKVEIIPNDQGNRITPSYVAFVTNDNIDGSNEQRLVGDSAKNQATLNPEHTIFDVKRLIGRKFQEDSVQQDMKLLPYNIVNKDNRPYVVIRYAEKAKAYAPEEISAMVLSKLKSDAEKYLGKVIDRAVVTVPAYFNDAQRHSTRDAGVIAGLHVERIINEPTAAAIAYGVKEADNVEEGGEEEEKNILVFDLGGGTFDVTLLTIDNGIFEVLATNGDTHLGGSDFDQQVMSYFMTMIRKRDKKDISQNKRALQKLRKEVERVKRALSSQMSARLEIEDLVPGYDLSETLSRAKFEELNDALFKKTLKPVEKVLEDAMLDIEDVNEIILVGGSTRIPKVQTLIKDFFNGKEPNKGINPDESVAVGAAIQGSILSGEGGEAVQQLMLLDVTPLSLGTAVDGELMQVLIKRGTTIPTESSMTFHTIEDNQRKMDIDVYEGERSMIKDNHLLGLFAMEDLPPAPRGQSEVKVTFKVDANGMLEVTAENLATKSTKSITITAEDGRLSEEQMKKMVDEAEQFAEQDRQKAAQIEGRNRLEYYLYSVSNSLKENEDKIKDKEDLKTLMDVVDEMMEWLDDNQNADVSEFKEKYRELELLASPVLGGLYENGGAEEDGFDDEL